MDRRLEAEPALVLRRIVDLAIGDEQGSRHAVRRDIRHRLAERGEQVGRLAAGLLAAGHMHEARFEIGDFRELVLEIGLDLTRAVGPAGQIHAGASVNRDDRDVGQGLPVLALEVRIGERGEKAGDAQGAQQEAAPATPREQGNRRETEQGQRRDQLAREKGEELNGPVHDALAQDPLTPALSPRGEGRLIGRTPWEEGAALPLPLGRETG